MPWIPNEQCHKILSVCLWCYLQVQQATGPWCPTNIFSWQMMISYQTSYPLLSWTKTSLWELAIYFMMACQSFEVVAGSMTVEAFLIQNILLWCFMWSGDEIYAVCLFSLFLSCFLSQRHPDIYDKCTHLLTLRQDREREREIHRQTLNKRVRGLLSFTPGSFCHLNTAVFCLQVIWLPVGNAHIILEELSKYNVQLVKPFAYHYPNPSTNHELKTHHHYHKNLLWNTQTKAVWIWSFTLHKSLVAIILFMLVWKSILITNMSKLVVNR